MIYYQRFRDPGVSDHEWATKGIKDAHTLPDDVGDHPTGLCSWALHGCRHCARRMDERAARASVVAMRAVQDLLGGSGHGTA